MIQRGCPNIASQICSNMTFIRPLIEQMTQPQPSASPTASEALPQFETLVENRSVDYFHWRLNRMNESHIISLLKDMSFVLHVL